jgi:hypothetical protein
MAGRQAGRQARLLVAVLFHATAEYDSRDAKRIKLVLRMYLY